jgi:YkoY family integral membrane protein
MEWIQTVFGPDPSKAWLVILNLIVIESVLSVDNAAVLATMVMKLPNEQRGKALRIGLIIGYIFRGLCLVLASYLMKIWWLGPLGGLYLLVLAIKHFTHREHVEEIADHVAADEGNWIYRHVIRLLGPFWATVLSIELMDLAFSIDNVLAATAYTKNVYLVCLGVFIGILVMRFAAQGFVKLMHRFPFLETCAFLVVGLLGVKLISEAIKHFAPGSIFVHFIENEYFKITWSVGTLAIFFIPIITHKLLGWPKSKNDSTNR